MRKHIFFQMIAFVFAGLFLPAMLWAQPICPLDTMKPKKVPSLESFEQILVLNQGRIKPLATYAENLLLQLSGRKQYRKEKAVEWLARFMFAPRTTFSDKIFLINNPEILESLKVKADKHRRYSYNELEPGYEKLKELAQVINTIEDKKRSVVDTEIMRVYGNMYLFIRLSSVFSYAFPHPDFYLESKESKSLLGLPEKETQFSFYDILVNSDALTSAGKMLEMKEHAQWDAKEKDVARILSALDFWAEHYANCPIGLIPTQSHESEEWQSPMDTILVGFFDPVYKEEIKHLRNMTMHYWNGSQLEFDLAARAFNNSVYKRLSEKEQKIASKAPLEIIYNRVGFFFWAKLFYFIGILLFLLSLISENKKLYTLTWCAVVLGALPHVTALIARVIILSRPPVSNLYETLIFVGLIAVLLGFILEWVNKNWLGLIVASTCGFILLIISGKFGAEGDTLQMLVAVLNSNFWLSTHVLAITIGYSGCCVAGIMGHIYILQALSPKVGQNRLAATYNNMMGILGFGLIMSFLGTALGGIWADQSWGRFWGWDPKENGALMIVLWCSIIFHARIAKIIHPLGAAVGCVLALINVMWAWFGVNLLNVGLHSYGFTSGIANALAGYVTVEIIFICVSVILLGQRNIKF